MYGGLGGEAEGGASCPGTLGLERGPWGATTKPPSARKACKKIFCLFVGLLVTAAWVSQHV